MLFFGGIFLLALGLLNIFGKDLMWEITLWGNSLKGLESERTSNWDTMTTIGGVVSVIFGLVALYAAFNGG